MPDKITNHIVSVNTYSYNCFIVVNFGIT